MPYRHDNVIRPFLLTKKQKLVEYAVCNGLTWWEDPTNQLADSGVRCRVRNRILPEALLCQPGLYGTVKRKIKERLSQE
jgi:tRNA(Ile)-lysidine synthase TilS/MesJ